MFIRASPSRRAPATRAQLPVKLRAGADDLSGVDFAVDWGWETWAAVALLSAGVPVALWGEVADWRRARALRALAAPGLRYQARARLRQLPFAGLDVFGRGLFRSRMERRVRNVIRRGDTWAFDARVAEQGGAPISAVFVGAPRNGPRLRVRPRRRAERLLGTLRDAEVRTEFDAELEAHCWIASDDGEAARALLMRDALRARLRAGTRELGLGPLHVEVTDAGVLVYASGALDPARLTQAMDWAEALTAELAAPPA